MMNFFILAILFQLAANNAAEGGGCATKCPPGNVYNVNDQECAGCWAGFFHENGGTSESGVENDCDICPLGFVTTENEEKEAVGASESTWVAPGVKKCSSCPSGRFYDVLSNFHSKSENDPNNWFNSPGTYLSGVFSPDPDYLSPPSCDECMAGKARIGRTCCTDCRVEGCECNK